MRIVAHKDEDFLLEYEIYRGNVFLHCKVFNWKPSSFKRGKDVFEEFKKKMSDRGVNVLFTATPNPRFAQLLGGEWVQTVKKKNKIYEVYRWVLPLQ